MQKLVDLGHAPQPETTPIVAGENSIEEDLAVIPNPNENLSVQEQSIEEAVVEAPPQTTNYGEPEAA